MARIGYEKRFRNQIMKVAGLEIAGTVADAPLATTLVAGTAAANIDGVVFTTQTAVALGNYANALNGKLDFGTAGRVTGLGGAICAELDLGAGATQGSYACFEAELNMSASGSLTGTRTSFLSLNAWGDGVGTFDTNGFLFDLNGVTAGSGKLLHTDNTAGTAAASLRCKVNGTTYYLVLYSNQIQHT
jgi:hypothetical protein